MSDSSCISQRMGLFRFLLSTVVVRSALLLVHVVPIINGLLVMRATGAVRHSGLPRR